MGLAGRRGPNRCGPKPRGVGSVDSYHGYPTGAAHVNTRIRKRRSYRPTWASPPRPTLPRLTLPRFRSASQARGGADHLWRRRRPVRPARRFKAPSPVPGTRLSASLKTGPTASIAPTYMPSLLRRTLLRRKSRRDVHPVRECWISGALDWQRTGADSFRSASCTYLPRRARRRTCSNVSFPKPGRSAMRSRRSASTSCPGVTENRLM